MTLNESVWKGFKNLQPMLNIRENQVGASYVWTLGQRETSTNAESYVPVTYMCRLVKLDVYI